MRNAFAQKLTGMAKLDDRIVLLSGDIGNKLFDEFKALFPNRFYNCGVAEQNMISMAAGMASRGLRPVVYSIAPFVTSRCYEQIKLDVAYHDAPVVIVGVGAGLGYANLGPTHHSMEDIALIRTIPNMAIMAPADQIEARFCLSTAIRCGKPVYIRLGKKGEPPVHCLPVESYFHIPIPGSPFCVYGQYNKERCDTAIFSAGVMVHHAIEAAKKSGLQSIAVFSCPVLRPLDINGYKNIAQKFKYIHTLCDDSPYGFQQIIRDAMIGEDLDASYQFIDNVGSPDYVYRSLGIDSSSVAEFLWGASC